jgi:dihydrodipicolinate synthase/N-acetylneuraminate lyase
MMRGIFPPIPTTFTADGHDVDTRAITANVQRWMRTGLAGVLALGSNGEAALVDDDESDRVVSAAREGVPSDRVLLVGTGRESTRATIRASARAASLGATAVLIRPPSFYKSQMTTDALVAHFKAVADASPVPVLLYNLPAVTGIILTPAIVATLAEHPNITGIKETSPDLERLGQFTTVHPKKFDVFCGWAPVVYAALSLGASGAILAVANVVPDECVELFDCVRTGRLDEALALQRRLTPLAQLVTATYGIAGLKTAMSLVGYQGGPVRAPLLPLASNGVDEIQAALARLQPELHRQRS